MQDCRGDFAWNDVQLFLALYRERTLGRAASALGVDTSTVSRRLTTLEEALGVTLFERGRSGVRPTEYASDLVGSAQWVEEGITQFAHVVDGLQREVAGEVRIACPPDAAAVMVLPVVERLVAQHPRLTIALVPGEATVDLTRRDADIALRIVRPTRGDLVIKRLGTLLSVPAASEALAARVAAGESLRSLPWIAWGEGQGPPSMMTWMDNHAAPEPVLRTSHLPTQIAAAVRGMGAALLPAPTVDYYGLIRLPVEPESAAWNDLPRDPLYLVAHRMQRRVPRVRTVWDALAATTVELGG